jgi:hypothetical protein
MQTTPPRYVVDPGDPRAPSQAVWDTLSSHERALVVAALPTSLPVEAGPPEGDRHRKARNLAAEVLERFLGKTGRRVYVSSELATDYPGERVFSPDVLAVLDVERHERTSWVVSDEGKGLDLVLEVHNPADEKKDHDEEGRLRFFHGDAAMPEAGAEVDAAARRKAEDEDALLRARLAALEGKPRG